MRKYNHDASFGTMFSTVTAMVSPAHEVITRRPLYDQIAPLDYSPRPPALVRRLIDKVLHWQRRARERKVLAELDDHLLRDIGVEPGQALLESEKPFWQD